MSIPSGTYPIGGPIYDFSAGLLTPSKELRDAGVVTLLGGKLRRVNSAFDGWETIPGHVIAATEPSARFKGLLWYDTALNVLKHYDGSAFVEVSGTLSDGSVKTAHLAADAVTAAKLADASVDVGALIDLSVTTAKIATDAVTTDKIDDDAVTADEIAALAVGTAALAAGAVTEAKITDGSVKTAKLAANAVTKEKLGTNSVTAAAIADGVVSALQLADDSTTPAKLDSGDETKQDAFLTRLNALRRDLDNLATLPASAQRAALSGLGAILEGGRPSPSADYSGRVWIDPTNDQAHICRNRPEYTTAVKGLFADATIPSTVQVGQYVEDLTAPIVAAEWAYTFGDNHFWVGTSGPGNAFYFGQTDDHTMLGQLASAGFVGEWLGQSDWDGTAVQRLPTDALPANRDYFFWNNRTRTIRKLGRNDYRAAGQPVDHWQWEPVSTIAANISIFDGRSGNLPSLPISGDKNQWIGVANDGLWFVEKRPEFSAPGTVVSWANWTHSTTNPRREYIGAAANDLTEAFAATVGDFYYDHQARAWRLYRAAEAPGWTGNNDHWVDMHSSDGAYPPRFVGDFGTQELAIASAHIHDVQAGQSFTAYTGARVELATGYTLPTGVSYSVHWRFLPVNRASGSAAAADDYLSSLTFSEAAGVISLAVAMHGGGTAVVKGAKLLAPLVSPAFTGTPTAPTPNAMADDAHIATKKYVDDNPVGDGSITEQKLDTGVIGQLKTDAEITTLAKAAALLRFTDTEKSKLRDSPKDNSITTSKLDDLAVTPAKIDAGDATKKAALRTLLAVLNQAEIDARAVVRYSNAEKSKLDGISAGATAVSIADVLNNVLAGTGITIVRSASQITLTSSATGGAIASLSVTDTLPDASLLARTLLAAAGGATDTGLTTGPHYRREADANVVSMRADRLGAARVGFSTYDLGELGGRRSALSGGSLSPPVPGIATIAVEPNVGGDVHVRDSDSDIALPSGTWSGAASFGPTIWFVAPDGTTAAYVAATGLADSTKDIALGSGTWTAGASDGTTLFFLDDFSNFLHAYTAGTRSREVGKDIGLGTGSWTAVVSDGTTIWVVESTTAIASAWTISTKARVSSRDIAITAGRDSPDIGAAFSDGTTLWFTDRRGGDAFAYAAANGAREEHKDVALGVGSWNAGTLSGPTIRVVDQQSASHVARAFSLRSGGDRVILDSIAGSPVHAQTGALTLSVGAVEVALAGPASTERAGVLRWISGYVPSGVIPPGQHTVKVAAASGPIPLHGGDWLAPLIDPVLLDEVVLGVEHRVAREADRLAPVRDVTLMGVPSPTENNYRRISIDHSIPRVWVGKRIPAPGTAAFGTSAPWPVSGKYLGSAYGGVVAPSPDDGYIYYDIFLAAWLYQVPGGTVSQWQIGDISTVTRNKGDFPAIYHWLGDQAGAVPAAGLVISFEKGHVYLFLNTSTGVVDAVDELAFTAAQDHTWRYEQRPLALIEDLAAVRAELAALRASSAPEELCTYAHYTGFDVLASAPALQASWPTAQRQIFNRILVEADDDKLMSIEIRWREKNSAQGADAEDFIDRRAAFTIPAVMFRTFIDRTTMRSTEAEPTPPDGTTYYKNYSISSADHYVRRPNWALSIADTFAEMRIQYGRYREAAKDGIQLTFGRGGAVNQTNIENIRCRILLHGEG